MENSPDYPSIINTLGWACLVNHIEEVLRQFGDKYVINFV